MFSIEKPCPVSWDTMTAEEGGRFCSACEKLVHDFRDCSNEEILNVIRMSGSKRICGRFRSSQLVAPKVKKRWQRFAAAALVVFSFGLFASCNSKPEPEKMGDVECVKDSATLANERNMQILDSTKNANALKPETPFKLSKDDSTKVADSIDRTKNHVRDFN